MHWRPTVAITSRRGFPGFAFPLAWKRGSLPATVTGHTSVGLNRRQALAVNGDYFRRRMHQGVYANLYKWQEPTMFCTVCVTC